MYGCSLCNLLIIIDVVHIVKQILLPGLFSMLLFSCKKEPASSFKTQVFGTWRYLKTMSAKRIFILPTDTARVIVIGSDGSLETKYHDSILF